MRVLILIMLVLSAKISFAETPWYAGAGIGMTNYQLGSAITPEGDVDIDSWETGFQLFGGYQFNEQWAIEGGYIDFGKAEDYDPNALELSPGNFIGSSLALETKGLYVNGQYHIPLNNSLSLDLVAGWLFGEAESTQAIDNDFSPDKLSYDDNGAMLGLAFTWQLARSFGLRGTANYYMIDYDNTLKKPWRLGADIIWNF